MIMPTTFGTGPFQPAIRLNNILYVLEDKYPHEDDAIKPAMDLVSAIDEHAFNSIIGAGYAPKSPIS